VAASVVVVSSSVSEKSGTSSVQVLKYPAQS
jgi:hypothetical protein